MATLEIGRNRAVIVRLSDLGRSVLKAIDIDPVPSEWDQLLADSRWSQPEQPHSPGL